MMIDGNGGMTANYTPYQPSTPDLQIQDPPPPPPVIPILDRLANYNPKIVAQMREDLKGGMYQQVDAWA